MGPVRLSTVRPLAAVALGLSLVAAVGSAAGANTPAAARHPVAASPIVPDVPRGRCIDDDGAAARPAAVPAPAPASAPAAQDARAPRLNLLRLVQTAVRRSNAVGASRLLAEAAQDDIQETRAAYLPQVSANASASAIDAGAPDTTSTRGGQYSAGLTATGPLYDGGRIQSLAAWRTHLAEAARLGEITAQEQVALQTVSLALDRSRYAVEAQVYQQYAGKMSCLVSALSDIVAADRGRASELVQAKKTQQQAELMRDQTLSQQRVTEVRLRRFVGDELPSTDGITSVMLDIPPLPELLAAASRASEIQALGQQADALDDYVRAVLDGRKPQIGYLVSATKALGVGPSHTVSGGLTLSVPLFDPVTGHTADAARRRAQAARLQREDALEERKFRMSEVHVQAEQALDRAHKVVDILRNSELVRNYTLQQWQQLGKRSLFDVMAAEGDHYSMRIQYVDALYDTQQSNALMWSLGIGLSTHLE